MSAQIEKVFIAWGGNCYGYMEEDRLIYIIKQIISAPSALKFAIQIVKSNRTLFGESIGLTSQISLDTFSELKSLFERKFDFSNQDRNLDLWFKYFCSGRLGLLYMFIVRDNDFDAEHKKAYFQSYQNDVVLIKHFGKEYYLDCAERLKFIKDPIEKQILEKTIRSFLEKLETDSGKQHIVLNQLRSAFEG